MYNFKHWQHPQNAKKRRTLEKQMSLTPTPKPFSLAKSREVTLAAWTQNETVNNTHMLAWYTSSMETFIRILQRVKEKCPSINTERTTTNMPPPQSGTETIM